jgi:hypothetical protein
MDVNEHERQSNFTLGHIYSRNSAFNNQQNTSKINVKQPLAK